MVELQIEQNRAAKGALVAIVVTVVITIIIDLAQAPGPKSGKLFTATRVLSKRDLGSSRYPQQHQLHQFQHFWEKPIHSWDTEARDKCRWKDSVKSLMPSQHRYIQTPSYADVEKAFGHAKSPENWAERKQQKLKKDRKLQKGSRFRAPNINKSKRKQQREPTTAGSAGFQVSSFNCLRSL